MIRLSAHFSLPIFVCLVFLLFKTFIFTFPLSRFFVEESETQFVHVFALIHLEADLGLELTLGKRILEVDVDDDRFEIVGIENVFNSWIGRRNDDSVGGSIDRKTDDD